MRKYVIIEDTKAIINFEEIIQDEIYPYLWDRLNLKYVISYDGDMPPSIQSIEKKSQEYTKNEIIGIMSSPIWAIYDNLSPDNISEFNEHIKFYSELL